MMRSAIAAAWCVLAGSARADDRVGGYVAGGVLAGTDQFLQVGVVAEAGVVPPRIPIALRVGGMYGGEVDAEGGGAWYRLDVGADLRIAVSSKTTLFAGPTLGLQVENWGKPGGEMFDDPPEHYTGSLIGGRIGIDITGAYLSVRFVIEGYRYRYTQDGDPMQHATGGGHLVLQASHAF